jgi:hypothetical protein
MNAPSATSLFRQGLSVLNVGLAGFADDIAAAGGRCLPLQWQPPATGDRDTGLALAELVAHPLVEAANAVAFERFRQAQPALVDIAPARELLPALAGRSVKRLLHAGPPIAWDAMCGPMQGALLGAAVLEGWAGTVDEARLLAERGEFTFEPCHHHGAVGPMAGVISPSMPLFVVENQAAPRNRACSNLNEGLGKVLRFGANGPEVIARLKTMAAVVAPALRQALAVSGPIELVPLMAQALNMGDEVHNRNAAATALLFKRLAPALVTSAAARDAVAQTLAFVAGNDHFFLNLSMAACKAMLDAAAGVPGSSMLTAMARNGVNFGIRLAGTGDTWFEAPANPIDGLYFPGYSIADAAADLGDSAITETAGVGGFAMAAAPAIVKFVGGTPAEALHHSLRMRAITLGGHPAFALPALDFAPAAAGIDARRVLDSGVLPVINSGIAHRVAGIGQIGAGVTQAPLACFAAAVQALATQVRTLEQRT